MLEQSQCPNCGAAHQDQENHDLGAALNSLRQELEYLWPTDDKDTDRMTETAVKRAVGGLSLELEYLWPAVA